MAMNTRYVIYARVHGCDSEAMLKNERRRWPGGRMAGFQIWMMDHWRAFCDARGYKDSRDACRCLGTDAAQEAFDSWLDVHASPLQLP